MLRVGPHRLRLLLLLVAAGVLAGCRLDLVAPIELDADGSAIVGLSARFDPRMLAELDDLGVDPTAELGAVAAADEAWELERRREEDGSLTVAVTRTLADDAEVGQTYRQLVAGLSEADPALELDVEVVRDDAGGVELAGTALLRPPSTSGLVVDGEEVGDGAEALAELVADSVAARVEVRVPGVVAEHDGVRLDARTVRFELEPGERRAISVRSEPPSWWARLPLDATGWLVAVATSALVLGGGFLWWGRRRRGVSSEA